ncbi:iron-sulfur cluster assembly scaffold protein [Qipengyuania sp. JC766]|uniref:iron-sulfur cluster assembly scaffold protein n=1 Tax=Qipengyuania sp. JC766 TaxID=3232139 RepID=UPI003459B09E
MTRAGSAGSLYTPEILGLAVELARYPFDASAPHVGDARSRSCGSVVRISYGNAADDPIGLEVSACAIGQAAAAIFARSAGGSSSDDLARTLDQLERWLADEDAVPDWPGIEILTDARGYPGRHGAIILPWKAAQQALSKREASQ